ncbi:MULTISPECIES: RagB/SusD family nutrient uptake outer membrane protein [Flavobacteriaceae]|uniref:RagB/SusD family nutrient uptake outer membrane protein n=2 Tax=Flavobacteriaceae TaxID=49546 RepID=A0A4Y8AYA7_9FLAO|nr:MULTISPECIES: RagB/SusD family nutrient uptake outer membrane protein [Flavobacteriaceae]TEW76902.1 RagB/SusD family nutrient uptake outer membrane protein [Gramella jeungdoensis]GGK59449.1 membrane protein [Lutibacter litoralis]
MLKKIILMLFVIGFITVTSCSDDFLETKPTDAIASADALATADNMALILQGLHRLLYAQPQTLLSGGDSYRSGNHYWVPIGDNLAGGLIHSASSNNLGWQDEARWLSHNQETSRTTEQLWYQRYHIIASTNAIINKAAEGTITEDAKFKEILGQAYAYRAYAYLSLVQHFAKGYLIGNPTTDPGVPLLYSSEAPFTSAPRSTVEAIYNQCKEDIDLAITYFEGATSRPTGTADAKSHLNIDVAYGLKARIALNSGDWRTAADAAKEARKNYPIMDESDYKAGFNTTLLPEVMWGSNVIATETTYFRSYFYLMSNTFNGSQVRNNPKIMDKRLYAQIPDTDYRQDLFLKDAPNSNSSAANGLGGWKKNTNPLYTTEDEFDDEVDRLASVYGWTSRHNTHPYMHVKMRNKSPGTTDPDDIILMRSSEMYLIEAEAEAMLNNITAAQNALKPLGEERDSAYDVTIYNTKEALMEHIKFQRGLELWGEGFLYTDKIRWDEGIDHAADGGSGASQDLYINAYQQAKPSVNSEWLFKIPQAEIDANPNLTSADQN